MSLSKFGVSYDSMIIRYCSGLAAKLPAFNDEISVDDKKDNDFLVLPFLVLKKIIFARNRF